MKKNLQVILILSFIAFFNATYLSFDGLWKDGNTFCDINNTISCTNVVTHPATHFFGVPFPLIAMVVYPVIALFAFLGLKGIIKKSHIVIRYLSALWILFNGYIIYQETFTIKAVCLLCLLCSVIIITIHCLTYTKKA